jgi:hypothetical protein
LAAFSPGLYLKYQGWRWGKRDAVKIKATASKAFGFEFAFILLLFCNLSAFAGPCEDSAYTRLKSSNPNSLSAEDSSAFVSKSGICNGYMDSVDTESRKNNEAIYKERRDPANSIVATGLGALLILGGGLLYNSGENGKYACEQEEGPLKICDIKQKFAIPIIGVGILSLILGIVSLSETTGP